MAPREQPHKREPNRRRKAQQHIHHDPQRRALLPCHDPPEVFHFAGLRAGHDLSITFRHVLQQVLRERFDDIAGRKKFVKKGVLQIAIVIARVEVVVEHVLGDGGLYHGLGAVCVLVVFDVLTQLRE